MNISVNGQSRVPPGFRFHPTEEELLQYYLRKKVASEKIDLDVIFEVDLNKLEPWDIQEKCKIGSGPQNDWYIFSHKDKKYPTGTRTNRATAAGFWKATGRDKVIYSNSRRIGMRKTLVFYKGRAPHGQKSDWIMHEYRLYDNSSNSSNDGHVTSGGEVGQEEGWVVCRIFKKKNYHKTLDSPTNKSTSITMEANHQSIMHDHDYDHDRDHDHDHDHDHHDQGALEQIFQFMGTTKPSLSFHHRFMKLPSLESPNNSNQAQGQNSNYEEPLILHQNDVVVSDSEAVGLGFSDWTALDRFVATHLNGQPTEMMALTSIFSSSSSYDHDHDRIELPPLRSSPSTSSGNIIEIYQSAATLDDYGGDEIDPLCHVAGGG